MWGLSACKRVFSVGFGPGLDSMSPARSGALPAMLRGLMAGFPKKTGWPGLPDCGAPTTCMLYPFGANCSLFIPFI